MKTTDLVSLDCTNGQVRRYRRSERNWPMETGRRTFDDWHNSRAMLDEPDVFGRFWAWLQEFRTAWTPPEEPGPRPTSPLRTAMRAAA